MKVQFKKKPECKKHSGFLIFVGFLSVLPLVPGFLPVQ